MSREDLVVKQWFDILRILQDCAQNLNHNTQGDLASFYSQKHAEVLLDDLMRQSFSQCVFTKTAGASGIGISITADDYSHTSNFHELLDSVFRPLRNSVRAVFRNEAIHDGTAPADIDPIAFEGMKTTDAYPTQAARQALVTRLAAVMPTVTTGAQSKLLQLLAKADTTAGKAIDSIL